MVVAFDFDGRPFVVVRRHPDAGHRIELGDRFGSDDHGRRHRPGNPDDDHDNVRIRDGRDENHDDDELQFSERHCRVGNLKRRRRTAHSLRLLLPLFGSGQRSGVG